MVNERTGELSQVSDLPSIGEVVDVVFKERGMGTPSRPAVVKGSKRFPLPKVVAVAVANAGLLLTWGAVDANAAPNPQTAPKLTAENGKIKLAPTVKGFTDVNNNDEFNAGVDKNLGVKKDTHLSIQASNGQTVEMVSDGQGIAHDVTNNNPYASFTCRAGEKLRFEVTNKDNGQESDPFGIDCGSAFPFDYWQQISTPAQAQQTSGSPARVAQGPVVEVYPSDHEGKPTPGGKGTAPEATPTPIVSPDSAIATAQARATEIVKYAEATKTVQDAQATAQAETKIQTPTPTSTPVPTGTNKNEGFLNDLWNAGAAVAQGIWNFFRPDKFWNEHGTQLIIGAIVWVAARIVNRRWLHWPIPTL